MTIDDLFNSYPERIRRAFIAGIREIQDQVVINDVIEALRRQDIQGAVNAMYIDEAAFAEFERELEAAMGDGGVSQIAELGRLEDQQGNRFVFRFNARDLATERRLRELSSTRVTAIVEDQRGAVRNALSEGLSRGDNPRTTALDIVGRIDRRTGRRTGGVLGLSAAQERYVANARRELADGDYVAFLGRERRDRRFDSIVRRAQREERPLTQADIQRLTGRYSDRLLALRGETIGRTETLSALNLGRYEAIEQLIRTGKVNRSDVKLVWKATRDLRTRDTHRGLDGESVSFGEAFRTARGARLRYPGDPQAPASEIVNCRCVLRTDIRYRAN